MKPATSPRLPPNPGRRVRFGRFPCTAFLLFALTAASAGAGELSGDRKDELLHMLRHDCGSCHGMTLKGGLGPSLLPEQLAEKPAVMLRATILVGRAGTPMPPWRGILSEADVDWLVNNLKKGLPDAN